MKFVGLKAEKKEIKKESVKEEVKKEASATKETKSKIKVDL